MPYTPGFAPHRNHGCRLREFVWHGRRCVSLENAVARVVVCADKGSDILEFSHKPTDTELLYQAQQGLGAPNDLASSPLAGGPFRDSFAGGWFIMMPNGPEPCEHRGAAFGHHGEATHLAWDYTITDDRPERIEVVFRTRLRRMPLMMERRMVMTEKTGTLSLIETVRNESPQAIDVLWGHHPCFGAPFIDSDCEIVVGDGMGVDVREGQNDFTILTPSIGHYEIHNRQRGVGFSLAWDVSLFARLGVWRQWGGASDYPAYGRHIVALEPMVYFPSLADAAARGTALKLAAGEARTTQLEACVFNL